MAKCLTIIEDDQDLRKLLLHYLEREGYVLQHAPDGAQGLSLVRRVRPDLVILDLMLPGLDGLEVCKRLKADPQTAHIPILMLTAKAEETDKVVGLELGADDYVTKPFSTKELVARVKAILRRSGHPEPAAAQLRYGGVTLDPQRHAVREGERAVSLTAKEFALLEHLLRNVGHVLSRDTLLNHVWGYDYFGSTRTVDVHINHLRKKIPTLAPRLIAVKPLGYKLQEEEAP
jgi:DNA-binding response OmpR family regulator